MILTQDSCPQPVGLLFAGARNDEFTLANPIRRVLNQLDVTIVGSCTASSASEPAQPAESASTIEVSDEAVASATEVRNRHERKLMKIPGAVGTGIGIGDQAGQPVIELYVKKMTPQVRTAAAQYTEGIRIRVIETGDFVLR